MIDSEFFLKQSSIINTPLNISLVYEWLIDENKDQNNIRPGRR